MSIKKKSKPKPKSRPRTKPKTESSKPEQANEQNDQSKDKAKVKVKAKTKAQGPEFFCVLRCTRPLSFGVPKRRWRVGDTVRVEADSYEEFMALCTPYAFHFTEVLEGRWPDRPHPKHRARLRLRRQKSIIDKLGEVADKVREAVAQPKPKPTGAHTCEECGVSFRSQSGLTRHSLKAHPEPKEKNPETAKEAREE